MYTQFEAFIQDVTSFNIENSILIALTCCTSYGSKCNISHRMFFTYILQESLNLVRNLQMYHEQEILDQNNRILHIHGKRR